MDPLQYQIVPYIFSSTSLTWDATTFPSTTSSTIVLIFLVLLGSRHHKWNKKMFIKVLKIIKQSSTCTWTVTSFSFQTGFFYDELYDVVKQNSMYYFIYKSDFRNNILFNQVVLTLRRIQWLCLWFGPCQGWAFKWNSLSCAPRSESETDNFAECLWGSGEIVIF